MRWSRSRPDDTFESERGIAAVVTLVMSGERRSNGVGKALLSAAEAVPQDRVIDAPR
jgi:hypothetical protein